MNDERKNIYTKRNAKKVKLKTEDDLGKFNRIMMNTV